MIQLPPLPLGHSARWFRVRSHPGCHVSRNIPMFTRKISRNWWIGDHQPLQWDTIWLNNMQSYAYILYILYHNTVQIDKFHIAKWASRCGLVRLLDAETKFVGWLCYRTWILTGPLTTLHMASRQRHPPGIPDDVCHQLSHEWLPLVIAH